jgi:hypothetical protein
MVLISTRRFTIKRATLSSFGIGRRDFCWGLLFLLLGFAMWGTLPDTRDYATDVDLSANWTIRVVRD